jgi:uncharacterized membrane protein YkgB
MPAAWQWSKEPIPHLTCRGELVAPATFQERNVLGTILIIVIVLLLAGALPSWNHSRNWGYFPSGGLGLVLIIVVILLLLGRI